MTSFFAVALLEQDDFRKIGVAIGWHLKEREAERRGETEKTYFASLSFKFLKLLPTSPRQACKLGRFA